MDETEQLRAATREAHEAMKDMRLLMRDARCLITDIQQAVTTEVDKQVKDAVRATIMVQLAVHHQALEESIDEATALVYKRFSEIGDVLMGEDRNPKRAGSAIHQLAQQWVADQS
jgi:fructose-1,6-bisphosphatase/inositol monophosphatase family enzyme